ncbi:hypothetical protein Ait01nite_049940 [Actinoplanes italicus]|nr:hypothetical protein Ait01nite_049940 [Actinoplanes italicus]
MAEAFFTGAAAISGVAFLAEAAFLTGVAFFTGVVFLAGVAFLAGLGEAAGVTAAAWSPPGCPALPPLPLSLLSPALPLPLSLLSPALSPATLFLAADGRWSVLRFGWDGTVAAGEASAGSDGRATGLRWVRRGAGSPVPEEGVDV